MRAKRSSRPSGPTQPESEREAKQVHLRLRPEVTARLDELAEAWGTTRSDAVARMIGRAPNDHPQRPPPRKRHQ